MPVQTRIQIRRDTAANWTSANPTLASGEIGFETDTNKLKVGNGSSAWTSLAYASGSLPDATATSIGAVFGVTQSSNGNGPNTALGHQALSSNVNGSNTAVGNNSLRSSTSGNSNTAIGRNSAYSLTSGSQNTVLGNGAMFSNTTGTGNVMIGFNAGFDATGNNKLYIANSDTMSPLIYGEFNNSYLKINGTLEATTIDGGTP